MRGGDGWRGIHVHLIHSVQLQVLALWPKDSKRSWTTRTLVPRSGLHMITKILPWGINWPWKSNCRTQIQPSRILRSSSSLAAMSSSNSNGTYLLTLCARPHAFSCISFNPARMLGRRFLFFFNYYLYYFGGGTLTYIFFESLTIEEINNRQPP